MNKVCISGRLTRDPDIRRNDEDKAIARFTIAVDRATKEKEADFPSCVAFGNTANFIEKYFKKGKPIEIEGRLQTGSYTNKDGVKVFTTDVVVDRANFVLKDADGNGSVDSSADDSPVEGFSKLGEDDLPF